MTLRLIAGINRYIDRAEMVVEQPINKRNLEWHPVKSALR
jgi:hypothetical protein